VQLQWNNKIQDFNYSSVSSNGTIFLKHLLLFVIFPLKSNKVFSSDSKQPNKVKLPLKKLILSDEVLSIKLQALLIVISLHEMGLLLETLPLIITSSFSSGTSPNTQVDGKYQLPPFTVDCTSLDNA